MRPSPTQAIRGRVTARQGLVSRARAAVIGALLAAILGAHAAPPAAAAGDRCKGQGSAPSAAKIDAAERSLLCLLNAYRAQNGLYALAHDSSLRSAARDHSADMVARNFFDHDAPPPKASTPRQRAEAAGYPTGAVIGENIMTSGGFSPKQAFEAWRKSPGHNENMLRSVWVTMGTGIAPGTVAAARPGAGAAPTAGTATQLFGSADTGASDTAIDLLLPAECTEAKQAKRKAKEQIAKLEHRLRKASSRAAKRKLRAKIRRAEARRDQAIAAIKASCNPGSF